MRIVRVAQHLTADRATVGDALGDLPSNVSATLSELPSGTLVTLELRQPWRDRRPRAVVVRRLQEWLHGLDARTHRTLIVAAAIRDGDRTLAAQRAHPHDMRGKWEFPGGKVERGESPRAALARECREELGTEVDIGAEIDRVELPRRPGDNGGAPVLILFDARLKPGAPAPRALEHLAVGWFGRDELGTLDWLATNRPFVTGVTLP
jgi:8-oxo-dGTP diphosphatase